MERAQAAGRKLMLVCQGTRGDVQPFAGLSLTLQSAGFVVLLGVPSSSLEFVQSLGVEATATGPDVEAFLNTPDMKALSARSDTLGMAKFGSAASAFQKESFPDGFRLLVEAVKSFKPDVMLACGEIITQEVSAVAGAYGIPFINAFLKFYWPSKYKASPAGEPWWMHGFMKFAIKAGTGLERGFKNAAILKQLPEAAPFLIQSGSEYVYNYEHPLAPLLIGHSSHFNINKAQDDHSPDLKKAVNFCGFWVVGKDTQKDLKGKSHFGGQSFEVVEAFLSEGEAPVYMGWGSMISGSSEHMTCLAVRSLMKAEVRGIIVGSWAKLDASMLKGQQDTDAMEAYAQQNVLFVQSAPHELLFPRCRALVHHGGLGTMAAGFRSGIPQVITPCIVDQAPNSTFLQGTGCGLKMPHLSKVTAEELSAALKTCLHDEKMIATARETGEKITNEDGNTNALQAIDRFVIEQLDTGKWRVEFEQRMKEVEQARSKWFFQKKFTS